jgi:hypothetical protein
LRVETIAASLELVDFVAIQNTMGNRQRISNSTLKTLGNHAEEYGAIYKSLTND